MLKLTFIVFPDDSLASTALSTLATLIFRRGELTEYLKLREEFLKQHRRANKEERDKALSKIPGPLFQAYSDIMVIKKSIDMQRL